MPRWANLVVAALSVCLLGWPASAQNYPAQQVTIVVPYSPGNGLDVLARHLAEALRQQMSATVIVENRAGAAGAIGTASAAKAAPDGYTLLFTAHPPFATAPFAMERPLYDPLTSFTPISRVATGPMVLVTGSGSPATDFAALVAFAKANPEKANYASAGPGSPGHLLGEILNNAAAMKLQQVAYRATEQGLADVISGNVLVSFVSMAAATPHIEAGTVRPLAIGARRRLPEQPGLPTLAEVLGRDDVDAAIWYGMLAPAGIAPETVQRLNAELSTAMSSPRVLEFMKRVNLYPEFLDPPAFAKALTRDVEFARKVVAGATGKAQN